MKFIEQLFKTLEFIYNYVYNSIDNLIIKSDEEIIKDLLKNHKDRLLFEKAVDELRRGEAKEIKLNNKTIKISLL